MIRVYVAGPITKGDQFLNVRAAMDMAHMLLERGYAPFVPHWCTIQHVVHPREYESWMKFDFVWLRQCEVLIRLPGESAGADREVALAHELGMPVFFQLHELDNWKASGVGL